MTYSLNPDELRYRLRQIGPRLLDRRYQARWTYERPTTGYCYLLTEVLYHFVMGPDFRPHIVHLQVETHGYNETHWYGKLRERVIDWTADQYLTPPPYQQGRPAFLLQGSVKTQRGKMSKRGFQLAEQLGVAP